MLTYKQAAARLGQDVEAVVRDTEALLRATGHLTSDRVDDIRDRTRSSLSLLRSSLSALPDHVASNWHAAEKATARAIRRQPVPSMGIAVGIGLLIGLAAALLGMRSFRN